MPGRIPTTTVDFDLDAVKTTIEQRLDEIYQNKLDSYDNANYEYSFKFTFLENGESAMLCTARIHFSMNDNPVQQYSELIDFVVV